MLFNTINPCEITHYNCRMFPSLTLPNRKRPPLEKEGWGDLKILKYLKTFFQKLKIITEAYISQLTHPSLNLKINSKYELLFIHLHNNKILSFLTGLLF